jgi:hypothetical protein
MKSALSFELYLADRIDRWEARRRLATTRPSEAHTPKSITRHRFESRPARGDWISVSPPQHTRPPLVAGNGAPLISGCAATRGRSATQGADECAEVEERSPFELQPRERRYSRRASSSVYPAAFVAGHDAPLIGERAAARGRIAMEGGDARGSAKSGLSFRVPASRTASGGGNLGRLGARRAPHRNARGERRGQGRARSSMTHSAASSPAAKRRSSANAPQRRGAARRKVARSAAVRRAAICSIRDRTPSSSSLANRIERWECRLADGHATDRSTCANAGNERKVLSASVIESKKASASTQMVDLLDVWHPRPAHRQNEGFATRVSCNICLEPGLRARRRTHDVGAGHDAKRPFTCWPCVGEFVQSDFGAASAMLAIWCWSEPYLGGIIGLAAKH